MTWHIDVCMVSWGADESYKKEGATALCEKRLVKQKEVSALVNDLINREILNKRPKGYDYVGPRKGFWIKVDVVEPEYINNEKWQGRTVD